MATRKGESELPQRGVPALLINLTLYVWMAGRPWRHGPSARAEHRKVVTKTQTHNLLYSANHDATMPPLKGCSQF